MKIEERVGLAAQIAEAVASAHALGILHNDLKPSNVLVSRLDGVEAADSTGSQRSWRIRVADFGVASFHNPAYLRELEITDHGSFNGVGDEREGTPRGTAMYRAPELNSGAVPTTLGDVYSLGVLLYQIVCGDFLEPPSPGWEMRVADPLIQSDIADAAQVNASLRLSSASILAERLRALQQRRAEAREIALTAEKTSRAQAALQAARNRRPWVIASVTVLVLALGISLWSYRQVTRDRDTVNARNATLSGMIVFLAQDVLGQSNPYQGASGTGYIPQQSLVDAITAAESKIDRRFPSDPAVAARLHETIADSLKSRTRYNEADHEYAVAAERYRQAEGRSSQNAIFVELKREYAGLASLLPGAVEAATLGFQQQQSLIGKISQPTAELNAWRTLVNTALMGLGPHPEDALPLLTQAVSEAEATPKFDPILLLRLKNQFCGLYIRMGDGAKLERVSREILALQTQQYGRESPMLALGQMYLEEAFYMQGRYADAILQANANFSNFSRVQGADHQLTLATLATKAAAEGQLERYEDAARDDLQLAEAEKANTAGARMRAGSLGDAAMYECHAGHFRSGMEHAREVIKEVSTGPSAQPLFANGADHFLRILEPTFKPSSGGVKKDMPELRYELQTAHLALHWINGER